MKYVNLGRITGFDERTDCFGLVVTSGVTAPIIGASKIEHLKDAVAAVYFVLSESDRKFLEELYNPHPILGHR